MSNRSIYPDLVTFCADLLLAFGDYRKAYRDYIEEIAAFKSEGADRFQEAEESESGRMYDLKVQLEEGERFLGKELVKLAIADSNSEVSERFVVNKIVDYAEQALLREREKTPTPLIDILNDADPLDEGIPFIGYNIANF